jgi:zinc transporter ZupT
MRVLSAELLQLLTFGLIASAANVLGGLVLFPSLLHTFYKRTLRYLLALSAGFMLSVTFFELLPNTIRIWDARSSAHGEHLYLPMGLLIAGYLITQFAEHTIAPHFHLGEEVPKGDLISTTSAYSGVAGLLVHTFFDGVSIAAAAHIDLRVGFLVFLAVLLHKFPEGFTVGSMVLAAGKGKRHVILATSLTGIMTFAGVVVFYFLGAAFENSIAYALPMAAGVTLYVAASDLIPEVNHHGGKSLIVSISVVAGLLLFYLTQTLLHRFFEHAH